LQKQIPQEARRSVGGLKFGEKIGCLINLLKSEDNTKYSELITELESIRTTFRNRITHAWVVDVDETSITLLHRAFNNRPRVYQFTFNEIEQEVEKNYSMGKKLRTTLGMEPDHAALFLEGMMPNRSRKPDRKSASKHPIGMPPWMKQGSYFPYPGMPESWIGRDIELTVNEPFIEDRNEYDTARFVISWGIKKEVYDGDVEWGCDGSLSTESWDDALKCILQHGGS
jgi:hypothetical protein